MGVDLYEKSLTDKCLIFLELRLFIGDPLFFLIGTSGGEHNGDAHVTAVDLSRNQITDFSKNLANPRVIPVHFANGFKHCLEN
ncbi:hypothetical protein HNY73_011759 [Argiope bruennichi]|uniref:Uncharacterized protein n=1 Tax=Argiope bruennichi TaxID=94029 RepID=A0A8T0EUU2_ARGBR|nr:hypothetical protein HNY73_011759 [Argiope bruennichi]